MGIVCLAGIFAVFLLLAWTLCRAAGWEKEREDLEQSGDTVLVKASHFMGFPEIVKELTK